MAHNELQTLSEIFNDKTFRIPDYQRGYSWEEKQLQDFWGDLENLNDKRIHYTGMITVEHQKKDEYYHIVDGQQRLTTIIILLKVLLDKFNDEDWIGDDYSGALKSDLYSKYLFKAIGKEGKNTHVVFGYEKDNPSDIFFKTHILQLQISESVSETLYTKNLENAKIFFSRKIKNLHKEKLETIIRKATKQLKFNFYEIRQDDELDVSIIFETINNRGKQLTTLELLKNRLMYLSTLLDNDKDEIKQLRYDINEVWKTIYEYIGKKSQNKIEDDIFLKDHWRMYFGKYDRAIANPEKELLLKKHFTIEQISTKKVKHSDIKRYILNLQKGVVAYYRMLNPEQTNYNEEIKIWLAKINRLGFDTFRPLMIAILISEKSSDDYILRILKLIESYMFIKFNTMKGSNTTIKDFFALAYEFHNEQYIDRVRYELETKTYSNGFNKLFSQKKFDSLIEDLYADREGWYGWKGLKYLLYEYELDLQMQHKGEMKLQWEEINRDSIEHIFPQKSKEPCWSYLNSLDNDIKHRILHSIGNLTLLSKPKNSQLGNGCFEDKKEIYSVSSYSTIEISKEDDWGQDEIKQREKKILNFMKRRWHLRDDNLSQYNCKAIDTPQLSTQTQSNYSKSSAFAFLQNEGYEINNQNSNFAKINSTSTWWFEPSNKKFEEDYYIVLYNQHKNILYLFFIPKNSIQNPTDLFKRKSGKIETSSIKIDPYDKEFKDTEYDHNFSFESYLEKIIPIDLQEN